MLGEGPSSGKTALLRSVWGDPQLEVSSGGVELRGRMLKEWDTKSVRDRMTYLREEELKLPLPAGTIKV